MASHSALSTEICSDHHPRTIRRDKRPRRDQSGTIFCDHPQCKDSPPAFRRLCEWNKHMDRHERPYKCNEPECEASPGFTYSGGLLRHQREVHKMHLITQKILYCPFSNCVRASGNGFTRKENLEEHKRRRHSEGKPPPPQGKHAVVTPLNTANNRGSGVINNDGSVLERDEPNALLEHLFSQLAQKDEIIRTQAIEIGRLYQRQTHSKVAPTQCSSLTIDQ